MDAEEGAIRRRQALADSLTRESMSSNRDMRSAASPWGNIAQALAGAFVNYQVGQQEDTYRRDQQAAMASILGGPQQAPAPMPSAPADSLTSAVSGVDMAPPPAQSSGPTPPPNMYGRNAGLAEGREAMLQASEAGAQRVGQPLFNPARPPAGSVPGIPGQWDAGLSPPTGRINPNIGGGAPAPMQQPQAGAAPGVDYQAAASRALMSPYGRVQSMAGPLASLAQAQAQEGRFDRTQQQQVLMQQNSQQFSAEQQARAQALQAQLSAQSQALQVQLQQNGQQFQAGQAQLQRDANPPRPVTVAPGATVLDPRTNQPLYTAPPAPEKAGAATEGERKNSAFLHRMEGAESEMQAIVKDGYNPSNFWDKAADRTPLIGNYLQTKPGQQYFTAATEWARAKLRAESGAVISDAEAANEARGYFPMPGDTPERIAQKERLRATAVEGMRTMAGRSAAPAPAAPPGAAGQGDRPPLSSFGR